MVFSRTPSPDSSGEEERRRKGNSLLSARREGPDAISRRSMGASHYNPNERSHETNDAKSIKWNGNYASTQLHSGPIIAKSLQSMLGRVLAVAVAVAFTRLLCCRVRGQRTWHHFPTVGTAIFDQFLAFVLMMRRIRLFFFVISPLNFEK